MRTRSYSSCQCPEQTRSEFSMSNFKFLHFRLACLATWRPEKASWGSTRGNERGTSRGSRMEIITYMLLFPVSTHAAALSPYYIGEEPSHWHIIEKVWFCWRAQSLVFLPIITQRTQIFCLALYPSPLSRSLVLAVEIHFANNVDILLSLQESSSSFYTGDFS